MMKNFLLHSLLVLQLALNPAILYADLSDASKQHDLMPQSPTGLTADYHVQTLNEIKTLSEKQTLVAAVPQTVSATFSPLLDQAMSISIDEAAKTCTLNSAMSGSVEGDFDAATLMGFFAPVGSGLRYTAFFSRENNQLKLKSFSSEISGPSFSLKVSYQFAPDGRINSYSMDYSIQKIKKHIELNDLDGDKWKAIFSSTDPDNKTMDYSEAFLNAEAVQNFSNLSIDEQTRRIETAAVGKISFIWGVNVYVLHYEKKDGSWINRFKTQFSGGIKTYIVKPNGQDALFIQNQTIPELPDFSISFGESRTNNIYEGYGLIFDSGTQKIIVDYPNTDIVTIQNKHYKITLNSMGTVVLTQITGPQNFDLNGDTHFDDADVDLVQAAAKEGRFVAALDLNGDGVVNNPDVKLISDKFVEELQKTNTVLFVDPAQANALTQVRDSIRVLTAGGMTKNIIVLIKQGEYYETSFELDERDSGKNGFQVIYRGYPGQEKPRIIGGKKLSEAAWQPAPEFSGNVYKMNLNVNGVAPEINTVFVDGHAVPNSKSGELAVADVPTGNNLMSLFPTATQYASWDGTKTIVRTMLPGGNQRPLREEHFFGVNMTLAEINARRAVDPTFIPNHIDSYAQFIFDRAKMLAALGLPANTTGPVNIDITEAVAEVWSYGFHMNLIKIKDINWATNTITLDGPTLWTMEKNLTNGVYTVAGVHSFMDVHEDFFIIHGSKSFLSEGEYFYSGGVLYYKAPAGETMTNKKVVIPTTKQVLSIKGTEAAPVHDIVFDRLDISVSQAVKDFKNNTIAQDRYFLPEEMSALYLKNTRNITIQNSSIHDTGAVGILMDGISVENKIINNEIARTGADGVVLNGDKIPTGPATITYRPVLLSHNNTISNNVIHHTGEIFRKADGIRIVQSSDNMVSDNYIHHIGFSGIFLIGMQEYMIAVRSRAPITRDKDNPNYDLYYEFNLANNNQFLNNEISDICLYSDDGAAFYTHSAGKGNVISGNDIHDIYHGHNIPPLNVYWVSSYGIYLDGGQSDYFTITNNRIYNINTELGMPMSINGSYNEIRNNFTEQSNRNAPIQFISGWGFAQRGNVLEGNTFKNTSLGGKTMMRLWQYLTAPYKEGMTIPPGAFIVNKKAKASDPDNLMLYMPANTFSSNDNNTYDFASKQYFIFTDWIDATDPKNFQIKLVKGSIPYTEWITTPLNGYTRVFDEHSVFI